MATILILAEQGGGELRRASLRALSAGQQLARRTGAELHAALLGDGVAAQAAELAGYGVPVHLVEDRALEKPMAATHAPALAALARRLGAGFLGAAATAYGKDVIPRAAASLLAGMASEVLGFAGEGNAPTFLRPMWAGNVLAEVELVGDVKAFTIRTTEFAVAVRSEAPGPLVREDPGSLPAPRTRHLGFQAAQSGRPVLTEARVVVAGGRGTRGDFRPVEELADALGGAVAATRAAVDAGWAPNDQQVGQTGKVVAPELYVAAGISGAIQHLAGMKGARVIVAVNKDPEAPIFQVADYGLVGDLAEVLPALAAMARSSRSGPGAA
jgi:electron transfer flavoprotein alpha subunit